eukprot:CAMPEP_0177536722 /NCGR_PEP_ID=MMETSP0369-20130122/57345_1 /TAXON_ID=447022 ORGANISM="Scrippsiella hangoei-like, Strain SHHI-4" /NCGR_SAMPLE_ID=MMETSP0369 /ASSEMBLY_ACC=CAM_ASM_000364 /LENGTH=115 /DNA_ID=CAMNT_0019019185 /DNA_START=8 /DNA_END=352 /DNA_ORIENTATION=+
MEFASGGADSDSIVITSAAAAAWAAAAPAAAAEADPEAPSSGERRQIRQTAQRRHDNGPGFGRMLRGHPHRPSTLQPREDRLPLKRRQVRPQQQRMRRPRLRRRLRRQQVRGTGG